jgi:two-component system chemotaxis sensor kinase CheA
MSDDEILQIFYEESKEHLDGIEDDLLALEQQGENADYDLVNSIFRAVHTIKGGCGFFGLEKLSALSHSMENVLDRIRKKEIIADSDIVNVLLKGADMLKIMVDTPEATDGLDIAPVLKSIKSILEGSLSTDEKKSTEETVEIKLPDGRSIFSINKYEFERAKKAEKGGNQIYLIEYDLIHDIEREGKTPWDVIAELLQLAVFIDSKVDVEGIGDLSDDSPMAHSIPFYALIATIIETDLIYDFLGLDESKVHMITETGEIIDIADAPQPETHSFDEMPISHDSSISEEAPPPSIEEPQEEIAPIPTPEPAPQAAAPPPPPKPKPEPQKAPKSQAGKSEPPKAKTTAETGSIRVNVTLLDKLMSLAGELVLARNQLIQSASSKDLSLIDDSSQKVDLITAELQEAIMATRMQAIGIVFHKFNRLVRDLSKEMGKEIELIIEGEDVELDKSILESIGDPLTHLVRNSLDHGIEGPEARESAGKPRQGTLKISAHHEAGHVVITIADDGAGISLSRVKAKALSSGICTHDQLEAMSDKELTKLIFRPGFSTAAQVTDISGRGVGMDVVHTNLTKLNGTIEVDSTENVGTTIKIKLPLTLAIIPSLLLSVGNERFSIPQVNLLELVRVPKAEIENKIEKVGNAMVIRLRDRLLPLVKLSEVIDDSKTVRHLETQVEEIIETTEEEINIAVVMAGNVQYGLIVDNLLDSSEIVVKPLGKHLKKSRAYAGATILGDGRVALILDLMGISDMMQLSEIGEGEKEEIVKKQTKDDDDKDTTDTDRQSLLVVHNAPGEPFGIPLGLVARIEKIKAGEIEDTGGRKAIKYRGGTLPLFRLEEVSMVSPLEESETYVVVVFKAGGREVGLMLSEILDVVETDEKVDDVTYKQTGIMGSTIINERITLLIDLYGVVYTLMPQWMDEHNEEISVSAGMEDGMAPTALIAEDSKFFMSQIKSFMEDSGYNVLTAEDGQIAYDILMENADNVNIVLTDIEMPNMDGFEFTEKVREDSRFDGLPILAVTSIAGAAAEQRGQEVGLDEYLIKLDRDEIIEKCSYYLKNGRHHE